MTRTEINSHSAFLTRALQDIREIKTVSGYADTATRIETDPKFATVPSFVRDEIQNALTAKAIEIAGIARPS